MTTIKEKLRPDLGCRGQGGKYLLLLSSNLLQVLPRAETPHNASWHVNPGNTVRPLLLGTEQEKGKKRVQEQISQGLSRIPLIQSKWVCIGHLKCL